MTDESRQTQPESPDEKSRANRASLQRSQVLQLPGLLAIALYLLLLSGVLILGVVGQHYPALLLILAAAFMTASAGLILLLRWAWAGALAAVFLLACYNMWIFSETHSGAPVIQGLLNLVFFLYLVRSEVRSRLR